VLQTLVPDESYGAGELAFGESHGQTAFAENHGQNLSFGHYLDVLKRRIFYFLLPFGLVSIAGLYFAAIQKPDYLSEGKILVENQRIAPDLVRPVGTATASERIQLIQQRILTRETLLSIASKFGLFPDRSGVFDVLDLMRESTQIKAVDTEGQPRQGATTIAFTVGFQYEKPELAMRVANEFVTLILDEDARSRTSRATDAVKILTGEAKDIEEKIDSTQMQILEVARRPHDVVPEIPDQQKSQLAALAVLRGELIQKTSVYSDAHPAVAALKKRIAAMEKSLTQSTQVSEKAPSTQADDLDALKRQRESLEKRLADANSKLSVARLSEKLDRDQQSERLQVIESPSLPQKPLKSNRLKIVGMAIALAAFLGIGTAILTELLDGSIRSRHQLSGVIDSHLLVSIPYLTGPSDIIRARLRKILIALTVAIILAAWGALATAVVFHLPVDFSWFHKTEVGFRAVGQ
jgi:uncharacterized protein involved in exopolysaccharide biosynthesis